MKRIKADSEVRALKAIIRQQRLKILELKEENYSLQKELEESRAKEGKGVLETMIESMTNMFASLTPSELLEIYKNEAEDETSDDPEFGGF